NSRTPLGYADQCALRPNGAQNRSRARRQRNNAQWRSSIRLHGHRRRIADRRPPIGSRDRRLTPHGECVALRLLFPRRTIVRIHLIALSLLLPCTALAQTSSAPSKPEVVSYNVKYVFGVAPPVARLKPGNILDANS